MLTLWVVVIDACPERVLRIANNLVPHLTPSAVFLYQKYPRFMQGFDFLKWVFGSSKEMVAAIPSRVDDILARKESTRRVLLWTSAR